MGEPSRGHLIHVTEEPSLQQGMRVEHTPGQRPREANPFLCQEGGNLADGSPTWPSKYLDELEKKGMELRGQGMPRKKAHFNKVDGGGQSAAGGQGGGCRCRDRSSGRIGRMRVRR